MSSYTNQGGLWDNQRKFEASHPDFVGSIDIAGVRYELVGWKSSSTNPKSPTINLKINAVVAPVPMVTDKTKDKEDDIPF